MKINNGTKKIDLTDGNKKPLILAITDRRKIIITKNKKTIENKGNEEKTYYSYKLNIPNDFLLLIQDNGEYGNPEKGNYMMHLLELHKQHYIIKLAPDGVKSIITLINQYGYYGGDIITKMTKKNITTHEQATQIVNIIYQEQIRNKPVIAKKISDALNVSLENAYEFYDAFIDAESKSKKTFQLTLPKKDMAYLQAYDSCQDAIEIANKKIEFDNALIDNDKDKKELFKIPMLYADLYFFQKFNIEYLHFEYELHIRIKADIDDAFVDYVKNDESNPGGIPGWLETLIIDWDDPAVQNLLGITSTVKDYDLHSYSLDKPILDIEKLLDDSSQD